MTLTDPLRKLARTQYALVSAPVRVLEEVVARLLPADAAVRVSVERQVDALDAAVERLLGTTEAPPAAGPAGETPAPSAAGQTGGDKQDELEERNRVAEELLEELEETPLVGELAEAPEDTKQEMADLRAKHLAEEFAAEQARRAHSEDS